MALKPILSPFIFGKGGEKLTPEQVAEKRKFSNDLWANGNPAFNNAGWLGVLGRGLEGAYSGWSGKQADKAEQEGLAAAREKVRSNPALSGYFGGSPVANALIQSSPAPGASSASPVVSALMQQQKPEFAPDGSIIRQGLVERGLPEHVADAFVLNFQDESGLNPGINEQNPVVPGSRGGFGLAQWTGPRRRQLEAFATQRGTPVSDLNTQLDFLMTELQGPESRAAQSILSAQDTPSAAAAIVNNFLRPSEEHRARREATYLGGAAPSYGGGQQAQSANIPALVEALSDPWVKQEYGPVIQALMGQEMQRQNAAYEQQLRQQDPMNAAKLEQIQLQNEALRNPVPELPGAAQTLAWRAEQAGLRPGTPEYQRFMVENGGGQTINNILGGEGLTPGQKKIDESFADTYLDWTGGGFADTVKQVEQLHEALSILDGSKGDVTGAIGALPQGVQAFVNPQGTIAREAVEEVVQRSLREILGAQFTEKEGERLIARAYNPLLPPAENRKRVGRLLGQISSMAEARQAMVDYFDENGTLRGYKGARPSMASLSGLMESEDVAQDGGDTDLLRKYGLE